MRVHHTIWFVSDLESRQTAVASWRAAVVATIALRLF
jgi:hypothetical protein